MTYSDESLIPGETILYRANISLAAFILPAVLFVVFLGLATQLDPMAVLVVLIVGFILFLQILILYLTTEFSVTNRRIIAKRGFIRRHSLEILLSKIESISINQSIDGRIFGFGTVTVIGSGGTRESFTMVSKPMELRKMVNTQIAKVI